MLIKKIQAKSIFTKSKIPEVDWAINPYVGCSHACGYCYAKFISRWRPDSYGKWGTWVEAKVNAPALVKNKKVKGVIYLSSICDPYQKVEKDLKITRNILENLNKENKLSIQTKSDLILRDLELLKEFKKIEVGLTINHFNIKLKNLFEPGAVSSKRRIEVLKILKQHNLKTFAFVSPIIPGLIDLNEIIRETKDFVDFYYFEFLNVRAAGKEFMKNLQKVSPESYNVVVDKNKFKEYIEESKKNIKNQDIKVAAIAVH